MAIRLVLADDHPVVLEGLHGAIKADQRRGADDQEEVGRILGDSRVGQLEYFHLAPPGLKFERIGRRGERVEHGANWR